ncbi:MULTISPECIES: DUF4244 domain-containing protein [Thermomonospora]|uniref:DUF4244 domain-containing protein n=1 Tax=Thermomonospora cellulosilytica TaxID=1411118 RepID=A0A7W3MU04_9ACTN|nr:MULTISPECIES: DUF4244 domain-containing protein [Thermomonospora]MBA9001887.1 hypothetical protein [Thermomonospora cellulosilytica]
MQVIGAMLGRWRSSARDLGMSTAEYAMGTLAAVAFSGLLYKVVTSAEVRGLLMGIIRGALRMGG